MKVYYNRSLCPFTTYRIGGAARKVIVAENVCELSDCSEGAFIIGGGSKLLISDDGYDGTIVINRASGLKFDGNRVIAQSGTPLPFAVRETAARGLSGLEFACQIPATVGGAVYMNAGAFDRSVSDVVEYVEVFRRGEVVKLTADQCLFGYRKSVFSGSNDVILNVCFKLYEGVSDLPVDYYAKRRASQPSGLSCGSVFRNYAGNYAAYYIEKAGLKGLRCGGAEISPRHANFIINDGCATARDVYTLIRTAKAEVFSRFAVKLEEEVIFVGEFT